MSVPNRLRLVACLFFIGAGVALFYMIRIARWERAPGDRFIVPDTDGRQYVMAEILPRIGQVGGAAFGLGVVLLVLAQISAMRRRRAAARGVAFPKEAPMSPARAVALSVVVVAAALIGTIGYRWYDYVLNAQSPYDEIGIAINSRLPAPLNAWGCGKLKERFARQVPPHGCADDGGRAWR